MGTRQVTPPRLAWQWLPGWQGQPGAPGWVALPPAPRERPGALGAGGWLAREGRALGRAEHHLAPLRAVSGYQGSACREVNWSGGFCQLLPPSALGKTPTPLFS